MPKAACRARPTFYAAMYCHAIATFALGEAYGMTGERRLELPLRRAIGYTIAAQDPYGGGWRYKPHDAGDTSQLGWQFMALKSAETAGIHIPEATRQGIIRYLQSVASHGNGGLASYRPVEPPSRTMTAEAMLCWQFLGIARDHPACDEAANFLLSSPPGVGQTNFYYWYYGTFVMYQFQGDGWQRWNTAVATQLVGLQNKAGSSGRFLGSRFRLGRLRRPNLQHGPGGDVPGGLLPVLAGVRKAAL